MNISMSIIWTMNQCSVNFSVFPSFVCNYIHGVTRIVAQKCFLWKEKSYVIYYYYIWLLQTKNKLNDFRRYKDSEDVFTKRNKVSISL